MVEGAPIASRCHNAVTGTLAVSRPQARQADDHPPVKPPVPTLRRSDLVADPLGGDLPLELSKGQEHVEGQSTAPIVNDMKYRGVEYTVVQGIGRHVWKWSVSLDTGVSVGGRTAIKSEAVAEAERAIDRALAPKKLRLVQPKTEG